MLRILLYQESGVFSKKLYRFRRTSFKLFHTSGKKIKRLKTIVTLICDIVTTKTSSTYGRIYLADVLPAILKDIRYAKGQTIESTLRELSIVMS